MHCTQPSDTLCVDKAPGAQLRKHNYRLCISISQVHIRVEESKAVQGEKTTARSNFGCVAGERITKPNLAQNARLSAMNEPGCSVVHVRNNCKMPCK